MNAKSWILIAKPDWGGVDGFLGTRGSIMLDIVFLAMFAVVPVLIVSVYLVKYRRKYELHRRIQLALGVILLLAVGAFEIDMQLMTDWEARAEPSAFFQAENKWTCAVGVSMLVHLCCAVPTGLLWIYVIVQAVRKFPRPAVPNQYSPAHVKCARWASWGMLMTAITGWLFYVLAFVL